MVAYRVKVDSDPDRTVNKLPDPDPTVKENPDLDLTLEKHPASESDLISTYKKIAHNFFLPI